MKNRLSINTNSYLQLLCLVPAICLLGFTGCSSLDAGPGKGLHTAFIGTTDPQLNQDADEDVVAANRNWYQMR
jgi:hypothetical protein